jgi:acetyl-CoA carboxylase beta subunit
VTASFAMLGDFILAEPKALIGFAGPADDLEHDQGRTARWVSNAASFCEEHGFVDFVVHRQGSAQRDRAADRIFVGNE